MNIKNKIIILSITMLAYTTLNAFTHGGSIGVYCVKGGGTYVGPCTSYQAHMRMEKDESTVKSEVYDVKDDNGCESKKRNYIRETAKAYVYGLSKYSYSLSDLSSNCRCTQNSWFECFDPYVWTGDYIDYEYKYSICARNN